MRADRTMYAVHPIPLSEVKAVRKHAPSFGTQHIVMVLTNGLTLPPLYFTAGGVRALFSALKEVCGAFLFAVVWLIPREISSASQVEGGTSIAYVHFCCC